MRRIAFLILTFTALVSCEITRTDEFIIKNNSRHDVQIQAYNYKHINTTFLAKEDSIEIISIKSDSIYSVLHECRGYNPSQPNHPFSFWEIDSIVIYFDNDKILVQKCSKISPTDSCSIDRDILDINNYYIREKRNRKEFTYTYTITNEDYQNAIPLKKE